MNARKQKGLQIAQNSNSIIRIDENHYQVKSQSTDQYYDVIATELGFSCSCPDCQYRKVVCKHAHSVEISLELRKKVESQTIISPITSQSCPKCNSELIVKSGIRHNKYGDIQRYSCKECKNRFSINLGFEKMKATPQIVTSAMQLYFSGESLRSVHKFLKLQGIEISHVSVYNWIKKYVSLMESYLDEIKPNVSDRWTADELYLKVKGNTKYLYALLDEQTRFLIATQIADTKYTADIRPMFQRGKQITQKRPRVFITDGARNFQHAHKKEFWTLKAPRTQHIRHIHLKGEMNTNIMERLNGEIRDREKVMRGLKKDDTKIIGGYRIYHNFIRTHEGLGGNTPADEVGIKVEGKNKWLTIIQNAKKSNVPTLNTKKYVPKN